MTLRSYTESLVRPIRIAGWHLTDRITDWFNINRMPADERTVWQAARTVPDLGQRCALWLEGSLRSQPAYATGAPRRPDPETIALIPVLAAANRAGFYTTNSQSPDAAYAGSPDEVYNTFVHGFADYAAAERLIKLLTGSGLAWSAWRPATGAERSENLPRDWWWGHSRREITDFWGHHCDPGAVDALLDAWQFHIEDPEPGRGDRLWPLLAEFANQRSGH